MVAQEAPRQMSVEEWRALLERSDIKYEYRNGWVVAMAGGSFDHARIAITMIRALEDALEDGPCRVYNSDIAVRLSHAEYRFPAVTVTRDERDRGRGRELQFPRLVVEVLSDSTEQDDRTEKFALCRACPSVEEYVLIATRYRAVEVHRRAPDDWTSSIYVPGEIMELTSIGARIAVADLYRRTEVPVPGAPGQLADRQTTARDVIGEPGSGMA